MSPVIDLNAILTPVVGLVADLVFPSLVAIEAPVDTQDDTGDPERTWDTVHFDVPALIAPATSRQAAVMFANVPISTTDVVITLAGDRDVRPEYRIRDEGTPPADPDDRTGDRWDVMGVYHDEARVTTVVLGRRRTPGTPDEDEGS